MLHSFVSQENLLAVKKGRWWWWMVRLIKSQCNLVAANCNPWDLQQTARVRVEGPVVSTEGHWVKRKATWEQGKTVRGSALTATTTLWRWCILYCAPSLPSPRQFLNGVVVVLSLIVLPSSGGSFDATLPSRKHGHSQDTTTAVGATSDLDSPLYRSRISAASQCRCK